MPRCELPACAGAGSDRCRVGPQRGASAARRSAGFTLIEAVMVISITGVLAAIVAVFIVPTVKAYFSVRVRSVLVDSADLALRRIGRDLRVALPNSTRVSASGYSVELIPATAAARYGIDGSNPLQFGTIDTSFDVVGPPLALNASQWLVFYNLGTGVTDSDAYAASTSATDQASSNRRAGTGAGMLGTVSMASLAGLPAVDMAAPYRVFVVDQPVSYRCDLAAGTITRYQNYGFVATQPDPPSGGNSAVLATGVTGCRFSYDAAVVASRAALVNLALTLTGTSSSGSESVSLHHAVHVSNLP
jgi:MSHA biogenesis protein MshO